MAPPELPLLELPELLELLEEPEFVLGFIAAAVMEMKGFALLPPAACWRLREVSSIAVWYEICAVVLSDEMGDPDLYAQIQLDFGSVKLMEPPDQLLQLEPRYLLVKGKILELEELTFDISNHHAVGNAGTIQQSDVGSTISTWRSLSNTHPRRKCNICSSCVGVYYKDIRACH